MKTDKTKTEKQITAEDVRIAAGLEEPWTFALEAMRRNLSDETVANRTNAGAVRDVRAGTGRTTRTLCKAAAFVLQGRGVRMTGRDHGHTTVLAQELLALATTAAIKLGAGNVFTVRASSPTVVPEGWDTAAPIIELQDHGEQDV